MASLLRNLQIFEVSSVDKAANKDARVLFWKRQTEETDDMDIIQKLQKLSHDEVVKICATDLVSKQELSVLIDNMAEAQRRDSESPQQAFARFVSAGFGKRLFAIHETSPGRDYWQQAAFEKFSKASHA